MANRSAGLVRFFDRENAQTGANQPAGTVTVMDVYASVAADRLLGTTLAPNVAHSSLTSLGTVTTGTWHGTPLAVAYGGTGLTTATLGDVVYGNGTNSLAALAGNATTTKKYLTQTGTGSASASPAWSTIAASELTGTSLPATITSSSLTGLGTVSALTANRQLVIQSNQSGAPVSLASFCVDDGAFGTYTGTRFGTTNNNHGYANRKDVLSYTRTGVSSASDAYPAYTIFGVRGLIDRYQNDGVTNPRESTVTVSRSFFNGGVGASAQGEGMDIYNNKYPEFPNGTGITYGIAMTKTGTDSVYREWSVNFRCPNPPNNDSTRNATSVLRILPYCAKALPDITKLTSARVRIEQSPIDVVGNPVNFLSSTATTLAISSISTVTHQFQVSSTADLFTGMSVFFVGVDINAPKADIPNNMSFSGEGIAAGSGLVSVTASSNVITCSSASFSASLVGAYITFGQYAYTVQSYTNSTTMVLTETAFASVSAVKWFYSYPSDHSTYSGFVANGGEYFAIVDSGSLIRIANTYNNALLGNNIRILTTGTGPFSFSYFRQTSVRASTSLTSSTNFVLPDNAPANGNRLTTDSSGNTTWSDGSPLTATNDTNVTLTLGGTPSTALLADASITAGWAGTLATERGGTGQSTYTNGQLLIGNTATGQLNNATLVQNSTNQVLITNGNGTITLSLPQGVHPTNSSPQFVGLGLGSAVITGVALYLFRTLTTAANASLYGILSASSLSVTAGTSANATACGLQDSILTSGTATVTNAANLIASGTITTSGTSVITTAAGAIIRPSLVNGTGATMTLACGVYVRPNALTGTRAIPNYATVYADTVAATGTVTNGYGGYFRSPTGCTHSVAVYTESLNVNVAPAGGHTLGRINCNSLRSTNGGIIVCGAALATSAVTGFLYLPTCPGIPTGVPNTQTGTAALVFDTTNNNLYMYNGGWKKTTTFA